ncbi:MAG: hypothetical protein ABSC90_11110 [Acidimicrobiales bacterium]
MVVKRTRHTREELRTLLVETGRSLLQEEGLGNGAEALTFKRVFERVERDTGTRLTNASVIRRVWENQADYQADVLVAVALGQIGEGIEVAEAAMAPVLAAVDLSTPTSREKAMREICRVGGALNMQAVRESTNWPLSIGVWAAAASGRAAEERTKIREALLAGYDAFTAQIEVIYGGMASFLGLRLRERFTIREFVVAADSLAQGYGLRDRLDRSAPAVVRPTGPNGEDQEWTIFGVGLEALVRQFFEIDPEWALDQTPANRSPDPSG